ncbi:hypothetical protein M5K25_018341 [Dendrobium thyrsiflorum]|uniref:Disease resistance protein n=1 Tax=Dendrobium thyrsiflorum TaxID=117978 RepID=A0ABD0UI16_DENTH
MNKKAANKQKKRRVQPLRIPILIKLADSQQIIRRPPVALEDWFEAGVAAEDGCLFPCLIELDLIDCPKLKELPLLPPKLKSLKIGIMRRKTWNFCSISIYIPLEIKTRSNKILEN